MGKQLLDQYSLLHYASGIMAYHFGIEPFLWFLSHATFEFVENTEAGMGFINQYLTWWPGGKPYADSALNMLGDNLSAAAGYWCAHYLDKLWK